MDRWQSLIDRQLNQAKQDGELSNLPGEGKPLNLGDDPFTPADKKIAYKIMRDNNIAPDWIALGRELDDRRAKLLGDLQRAASGDEGTTISQDLAILLQPEYANPLTVQYCGM